MQKLLLLIVLAGISACRDRQTTTDTGSRSTDTIQKQTAKPEVHYRNIGAIKTPEGYTRIQVPDTSFAGWLRTVPLKRDKTVYLYNGEKKPNQSAQFAVIDISTGNKDLQQCADAVMRLRAEYLFSNKLYAQIAFMDYAGKWYRWGGNNNRAGFDNYLQHVFGWCGSASLEKQLKAVPSFTGIKPGDVLVQGGFPGHAVIVVDMAMNAKGEKIYMLAQGYQPAQDMHVLMNFNDPDLNPWYAVNGGDIISTPQWTFTRANLKTW